MRKLHAQRVIDNIADGGPVAGAGEAVGKTPVLQRIGHGASSGLDIVKNLDRPRQPSAKSHVCSSPSSPVRALSSLR